jgi:superfamily II DNA or RNA helicase
MPLSFKGRLIQYAGRLHRASSGKREVIIYDYIDKSLALGISMFRKRLTTYRKMGYTIIFADGSSLAQKVIKGKKGNIRIGNSKNISLDCYRLPGVYRNTQLIC